MKSLKKIFFLVVIQIVRQLICAQSNFRKTWIKQFMADINPDILKSDELQINFKEKSLDFYRT